MSFKEILEQGLEWLQGSDEAGSETLTWRSHTGAEKTLVTIGEVIESQEGSDNRVGAMAKHTHPILVALFRADIAPLSINRDKFIRAADKREYVVKSIHVEDPETQTLYCAPTGRTEN